MFWFFIKTRNASCIGNNKTNIILGELENEFSG